GFGMALKLLKKVL
uniref:Macropin n=1 Tax=Macropis fulvipes TaxID=465486 RepID=MAC1_MACFV|nr:RecName: Full=Macropin; AltName: Full=MAC-1 [Macropis fulvipes]